MYRVILFVSMPAKKQPTAATHYTRVAATGQYTQWNRSGNSSKTLSGHQLHNILRTSLCMYPEWPHTLSVWCKVWKALCSTMQKIDEKIWNINWPLGFTPNCTERSMIKKLLKHSYVQVQHRNNLTNRRAPTNRKLLTPTEISTW
jgi:hypothetical protein